MSKPDSWNRSSILRIAQYPEGNAGMMRNKRFQFGDRRQNATMPGVPFKDSNGATIKKCRRKILDRRTDNTQADRHRKFMIG